MGAEIALGLFKRPVSAPSAESGQRCVVLFHREGAAIGAWSFPVFRADKS